MANLLKKTEEDPGVEIPAEVEQQGEEAVEAFYQSEKAKASAAAQPEAPTSRRTRQTGRE